MSEPIRSVISGPVRAKARGRCHWKRPAIALTVLGVAAQTCLSAGPASATLTDPGVSAGKNITVFHNIDMVAVFGYGPVGESITVEVHRDGTKIGTATGPAVLTDEGPGLEVNHGVDGTPAAGDCWSGAAPDIRPGDTVTVRSGGLVNRVTVDNIHYTGRPSVASNGDVVVSGVALRGTDGAVIPASSLDSAEFRDDSGKYRATPDSVLPTPGVTGGFTMRYQPPYTGDRNRDNLTLEQRKQALLGDGHAIGFGHTDPLPRESMLVDGIADVPGHAAGCGGTPAEPEEPPAFTPDPTDTVKPVVVTRVPAPNAVGVSRGTNVTAEFSETVSGIRSGTFILRRTSNGVIFPAVVTYDAATRVAKLNPSGTLRASTKYTATLTSGVKDTAGNSLTATRWTFKTRS